MPVDDPKEVPEPERKGEVQEIEHGAGDVIPTHVTGVVERVLQQQVWDLPETDQPFERGYVVDRHPELAAEASQVLVRQEEDEKRDPIREEQPRPPEDEGRE